MPIIFVLSFLNNQDDLLTSTNAPIEKAYATAMLLIPCESSDLKEKLKPII